MKVLTAAAVVLLLTGCAHVQQPKQPSPKMVVKHAEPCPCSPTAPTPTQVIKRRWYDGFKVRWLH